MDFVDKLYHIQDRPHDQMSIFQSERWHKIDSSWKVEDHARVAIFCTENGKMYFIFSKILIMNILGLIMLGIVHTHPDFGPQPSFVVQGCWDSEQTLPPDSQTSHWWPQCTYNMQHWSQLKTSIWIFSPKLKVSSGDTPTEESWPNLWSPVLCFIQKYTKIYLWTEQLSGFTNYKYGFH